MTYPQNRITYISETAAEYSTELGKIKTLHKLREFIDHWWALCNDAYNIVQGMNAATWKEFKTGWALEKKHEYAGDVWAEKYSAVIMPEILFRVSVVSANFHVPWGTAFIRLKEEGFITKNSEGIFVWNDKEPGDSINDSDRG